MRLSTTSLAVLAAALLSGSAIGQPAPKTAPEEPKNAGVSIWTQNVTGFRKKHGSEGGYTKKWDLSDLPVYQPRRQVKGTLRIWGNNYLKDGPLGEYWRAAFKKYQPGITLEYHLPTGAVAVSALATGVADIGMNYKATLTDLLIFEQAFGHSLTKITALSGSFDVYGWAPPGIIVVHKDNPLSKISMKQLDGVFGGARKGGYKGSVWHTEYPYTRGADENIRTWGQLGLTGEWANKPIRVCGQNLSAGAMLQFSNQVLMGSLQFVENYDAYTNYIGVDGKMNSWSSQVQRTLANDRYAICYASPMTLSPAMKELAIQDRAGGDYVQRTLETTRDNSFPLTHHAYFFINHEPGKPIDPKVEEFIRFVLSRQGQDEVQHEGRYLPLTGDMVRRELEKLK